MLDISDGLGRDAGRLARASGVGIELDDLQLAEDVAQLQQVVSEDDAWRSVLEGGEEHSLLACFPPGAGLPDTSAWAEDAANVTPVAATIIIPKRNALRRLVLARMIPSSS